MAQAADTNNMTKEIINLQVAAEGFGSYAAGILPADIATAAGAFGASMQQIKNILNIPIEKFAQVVSNVETTKGLAVNGTSVPTDNTLVDAALPLVALGSGPSGTYTSSDFFGSMSGIPYDWKNIQRLILELQTPTLLAIYANLYTAVQGGISATVQTYIDQANAEIAIIRSVHPGKSIELNTLWESIGTQLTIEQRTRNNSFYPLPNPRDAHIALYPIIQYSFVDSIPKYAVNTLPGMYAQTIEAISDLDLIGGQSIVAMMRENRNEARLSEIGIPLDNNIPAALSLEETTVILEVASDVQLPDTGTPAEPGSFAESPYQDLVPPELNVILTSGVLLPSVPTIQEAIDEVIRCNCDCWEIL